MLSNRQVSWCLRDDIGGPNGMFTGDIAGVALYDKALDEQAISTRWELAKPLMRGEGQGVIGDGQKTPMSTGLIATTTGGMTQMQN